MLDPRNRRGTHPSAPAKYGASVLGAPLEVWLPTSGSTETLFLAGVHGEEPDSTFVLSRTLRSLAAPPEKSGVILAANPDGLARGTRGNANGVDLNRNLPASNWRPAPVTHRWTVDEASEVELSPGEKPASEPETRALLELFQRLNPKVVIAIHGPLACIDDPRLSPLGKQLAEQTGLPLVADIGYPCPGSLGSWAEENNLHVITYELQRLSLEELGEHHIPVLAQHML